LGDVSPRSIYPDKQKTTALAVDEFAIVWSGFRPTWASFRDHGLARGAPCQSNQSFRFLESFHSFFSSTIGYSISISFACAENHT